MNIKGDFGESLMVLLEMEKQRRLNQKLKMWENLNKSNSKCQIHIFILDYQLKFRSLLNKDNTYIFNYKMI